MIIARWGKATAGKEIAEPAARPGNRTVVEISNCDQYNMYNMAIKSMFLLFTNNENNENKRLTR